MRQRSTRQDRRNQGRDGRQADLFIIVRPASLEAQAAPWSRVDGGEALGKDGSRRYLDCWRRATPLPAGAWIERERAGGGGRCRVRVSCQRRYLGLSLSLCASAIAGTACSWWCIDAAAKTRYEVGGEVEAGLEWRSASPTSYSPSPAFGSGLALQLPESRHGFVPTLAVLGGIEEEKICSWPVATLAAAHLVQRGQGSFRPWPRPIMARATKLLAVLAVSGQQRNQSSSPQSKTHHRPAAEAAVHWPERYEANATLPCPSVCLACSSSRERKKKKKKKNH